MYNKILVLCCLLACHRVGADKPSPTYKVPVQDSFSAPGDPATAYGGGSAQDTYGSPRVPSQDNYGSPSAPAQDSYGSPKAPSQDTYGSSKAPAQETYGSPKAPAQDNYGAPQTPVASYSQPASTGTQGYYYYYYPVSTSQQSSNTGSQKPAYVPSRQDSTLTASPWIPIVAIGAAILIAAAIVGLAAMTQVTSTSGRSLSQLLTDNVDNIAAKVYQAIKIYEKMQH